jgi:hypothetical protein
MLGGCPHFIKEISAVRAIYIKKGAVSYINVRAGVANLVITLQMW